jgi:hypothetical protein
MRKSKIVAIATNWQGKIAQGYLANSIERAGESAGLFHKAVAKAPFEPV